MIDILWHGRGGQGAFTAAKLLGAAYSLNNDNAYAIAFPSFGPERRGAPIRAFTKLSNTPVGDRSEISLADFEIFLDDTLFSLDSVGTNLKPNGKVLVCTKQILQNPRVITFDGVSLAEKVLGFPITNTVVLGALAAVFTDVSVEDLSLAIEQIMPARLVQKNIVAVETAYKQVQGAL